MQQSIPAQISSKQLANCLDISERAVHLRAQKGDWPRIFRRGKGGSSYVYMVSGLPEDVRAALMSGSRPALASAAAQAGLARARELADEEKAAQEARRHAKEAGLAAYERLPAARQKEAQARREILCARDAFISAARLPKKRGTLLFIREYQAGAIRLPEWIAPALGSRQGALSLSWATLHRWERAFADGGLAALASGYVATRETSIAVHMQDFIRGLLAKRPHLGLPTVHQALCARFEGQAIPSQSALRRFTEKWRAENKGLILYLTSFDQWRNQRMIAMGQAAEQVERLNQVWEFDSTPGDIMLTDGRHCLIGVIDVYSRRAKLHVTPTSRSSAVAALTRRAILDWGVPEIAKTDNGSDYVSAHMVRVFESLEIEQVLCRPFHPEDKPHIERLFKTLLHSIFELLPGYIGHSVAERKQIEDRRSFAQRIMGQGQDPVEIKMSAAQLQSICDRWCDAVYHHNVHANLGTTPTQMALNWTAPVRRIADERTLDILLSPAPDREGTRLIGKDGIKVQGGTFIAAELGPHVGETVFVLLDALDYGGIYVFLMRPDGAKEFLCRAVDPARTGHDRAEIAAKGQAYQKEYMREGSKQLRRLSREAATERIGEEILSYRERQRANVREFPKRSETYSTPAMEEAARAVADIERVRRGPCPVAITAEQDRSAAELIDMAQARRDSRPLPATEQEKYEQICDDLRMGVDVADAELAWMKRYELWLETGGERAQTY
jgi:transposase InsO family protein